MFTFRPDYLDAWTDSIRPRRQWLVPRLNMCADRMKRVSMAEHKSVLVVGAGAIGGVYAAYLAKVADVAVLDTNRAHVEAIRKDGLKLTGCTESATKLAAFASAAEMGRRPFDAVIILVKSQATGAAFESIRPRLEGRPVLVTFQNGMGNGELLARISDLEVAHGVSFEASR